MAPTVFGLHLGPPEFRWGKFKSSYMFKNRDYHLRRTKFVVYQLAMIFCVVSESLGTAALSDYVDQQAFVQQQQSSGRFLSNEYNDDYVGCASYNIWCGIFVAFIFGAAFFFDLFWPERHEDRGIRLAWRAYSVAACIFVTADVAVMTWVTSSRRAYITGPQAARLEGQLMDMGRYALVYRKNGRAIASLVFLWPGWLATIASTVVMWKSLAHDDRVGPFSTHARQDCTNEMKLGNNVDGDIEERQPSTVPNETNGAYIGSSAAGVGGQSVPLGPTAPEAAQATSS